MTDTQLQEEWLKTNKPKVFTEVELVYTKPNHQLYPTQCIAPIKFDRLGKRIYKFLNKTPLAESLDESTRNYGA